MTVDDLCGGTAWAAKTDLVDGSLRPHADELSLMPFPMWTMSSENAHRFCCTGKNSHHTSNLGGVLIWRRLGTHIVVNRLFKMVDVMGFIRKTYSWQTPS